jgi:hypothetical protein
VTINLFLQEDRSPSGTGRAQFQTRVNDQRETDWNVQATTNTMVDPNELAPTHPHWAFCACGRAPWGHELPSCDEQSNM